MKYWKVLFWIFAFLLVIDFIALPLSNDTSIYDFIGLFVGGILLFPYYGYAYQKAVGWKLLWQISFFINVLMVVFSIYDPFIESVLHKPDIAGFFSIVIAVLLCMLLFIPFYRYAFHSNHLWSNSA